MSTHRSDQIGERTTGDAIRDCHRDGGERDDHAPADRAGDRPW